MLFLHDSLCHGYSLISKQMGIEKLWEVQLHFNSWEAVLVTPGEGELNMWPMCSLETISCAWCGLCQDFLTSLGPLFHLHLVRLPGPECEIHVLTLSIHREVPDAGAPPVWPRSPWRRSGQGEPQCGVEATSAVIWNAERELFLTVEQGSHSRGIFWHDSWLSQAAWIL